MSLEGVGEEAAVDSIDDRLDSDHVARKVAAVETSHGVSAALDAVELDIDVALGVGICCQVNNVTVLLLALLFDVLFETTNPIIASLTVLCQRCSKL